MGIPAAQVVKIVSYVLTQKLKGRKRYPLVLMLEPLFRCNLECAGCGKIQYPDHILKKRLTVEQCLQAAADCGAPVVSLPGGEPLIHPEIEAIVAGLIKQGRYIFLCTNAILLKRKLDKFTPNKQLTFSVHLDGLEEEHDLAVCRDGVFQQAIDGVKEALRRGFRVTTNTTLFAGADPQRVRKFFDFCMELGVEGMGVSPGYSYEKAPDQQHFLHREQTRGLFRQILGERSKGWRFNQSPLFLDFLQGHREYQCTPWGNPTYNIFGWQKPCYLLGDGYAQTFQELMETTDWDRYGTGRHEKCADCMVHCGYEPTAVDATFSSWRGLWDTIRLSLNPNRPTPGFPEAPALPSQAKS